MARRLNRGGAADRCIPDAAAVGREDKRDCTLFQINDTPVWVDPEIAPPIVNGDKGVSLPPADACAVFFRLRIHRIANSIIPIGSGRAFTGDCPDRANPRG